MARIIPKLNLNKTPGVAQSSSLIFAKNIRIDANENIRKDYGLSPITLGNNGEIEVEFSTVVHKCIDDIIKVSDDLRNRGIEVPYHYSYYLEKLKKIINYGGDDNYMDTGFLGDYFQIVGTIQDSNDFYMFLYGLAVYPDFLYPSHTERVELSCILKYSEDDKTILPCNCNWTYSGGTINGCVVNNLIGEKILNVGEVFNDNTLIPLKCINLSKSSYIDDETLYTQTPNIPIINLNFAGRFSYVIPCGVYQFYVRYKIRDEFYTDWFPASKELFAGNENTSNTNFGTVKFVNTHRDSDESFIFNVECLFSNIQRNYESFQIGFIVSHDDTVYARAWKHFHFTQTSIKFDYNAKDADEIEVTDLTKTTYQLYNVGNLTSFKNKLYISNYTETNFNEDLQSYADNVQITIQEQTSNTGYGTNDIISHFVGSKEYIAGIIINEGGAQKNVEFDEVNGVHGIIYRLMNAVTGSYSSANKLLKNSYETVIEENDANGVIIGGSWEGFEINGNRDNLTTAQKVFSTRIKSLSNYAGGPYFTDNNVVKTELDGVTISNDLNTLKNKLYNTIQYLTFTGQLLDSAYKSKSNFEITLYREASYDRLVPKPIELETHTTLGNSDLPIRDKGPVITPVEYVTETVTVTYEQKIRIYFTANPDLITTNNSKTLIEKTTLIPYQRYKFYIHYVKQTGEITNGYFCNGENAGEITIPYKEQANSVIYPVFSHIRFPKGYVACFFSIFHSGIYASSVFNIKGAKNESDELIAKEGSCIELNTRLIPSSGNILCKQIIKIPDISSETGYRDEEITVEGTHHYSSDASIIRYFGCDGIISFDKDSSVDITTENKLLYAINDYESQQAIDVELIKCTPFISRPHRYSENSIIWEDNIIFDGVIYDKLNDLNLLGYICRISPLDRDRGINYYTDGSNVYHKNESSNISGGSIKIQFKELSKYNNSDYRIKDFDIVSTNVVSIYSNFNLNYLSLSEEPKTPIKSYYNRDSTVTTEDTESSSVLWRLFTSLTLTDVYELVSMYKEYTRKTYLSYQEDNIVKFDNTVRSSNLIDDERKVSIYKFEADDYYNVPTNRGKIINMVSIGDGIIVHTRDSIFRFTGSNNLSGSTGEIVTNETEPFDTGISEIFGSDFGFAGIQNKQDSIITENGYIFFDRDTNNIYLYAGQNRIDKISDKIENIFNYDTIKNIRFANDFYNNRFFLCVIFDNNDFVTLSFSTLENVKDFISLHDFYFEEAFNTKSNCYFLTSNRRNVCEINKKEFAVYEQLGIDDDNLYPIKEEDINRDRLFDENCTLNPGGTYIKTRKLKSYSSIIDVIINENYEIVKTLNSVSWCSKIIEYFYSQIDKTDIKDLLVSEPKSTEIPCSAIRIYTDTCATDLLSCANKSNNYNINNPNSYIYPRFNQGKWTINYFRNILNSSDESAGISDRKKYVSDINSLVEGKYFVIRFIFDENKDFSLENLSININSKI